MNLPAIPVVLGDASDFELVGSQGKVALLDTWDAFSDAGLGFYDYWHTLVPAGALSEGNWQITYRLDCATTFSGTHAVVLGPSAPLPSTAGTVVTNHNAVWTSNDFARTPELGDNITFTFEPAADLQPWLPLAAVSARSESIQFNAKYGYENPIAFDIWGCGYMQNGGNYVAYDYSSRTEFVDGGYVTVGEPTRTLDVSVHVAGATSDPPVIHHTYAGACDDAGPPPSPGTGGSGGTGGSVDYADAAADGGASLDPASPWTTGPRGGGGGSAGTVAALADASPDASTSGNAAVVPPSTGSSGSGGSAGAGLAAPTDDVSVGSGGSSCSVGRSRSGGWLLGLLALGLTLTARRRRLRDRDT